MPSQEALFPPFLLPGVWFLLLALFMIIQEVSFPFFFKKKLNLISVLLSFAILHGT